MQKELQASEGNMWWRLMRPHTLTASFVPVAVGTAAALYVGHVQLLLVLSMLVASMLIQAATNMFNEYFDYVKGLDTAESVGIGGTIVRDGIAPKRVLQLAITFYVIAALLGVYICAQSSWWVAVIGLICMAVGYLYSGGPYPISSTPFGELFSGVFMGTIIIMITFFIQSGRVTTDVFLLSISSTLLIGAINLANNIRDLDGDKEGGRRTLAILLGRPKAVTFLSGIFAIAFAWIAVLVAAQAVTVWALLVFLSIPKAVQASRQFRGKTKPIEMMPAMKATAQLNTFFGFLLSIGLIVGYLV